MRLIRSLHVASLCVSLELGLSLSDWHYLASSLAQTDYRVTFAVTFVGYTESDKGYDRISNSDARTSRH